MSRLASRPSLALPPPLSLPVALAAALAVAVGASCGTPTEVVVQLNVAGAAPPSVLVKVRRSTPFNDNPATLPAFVTSALNGADLDLRVVPQGATTLVSLLPAKDAPSDVRVTVSAAGYDVVPAEPQAATFVEGKSATLTFNVSARAPDMAMPALPDMATPRDQAPQRD